MTEKQLQTAVVELAERFGYRLVYHTHDSRKSDAGFPDLVCVKPGRLVALELKADGARTARERRVKQAQWLAAIATVPGCSAALIQGADDLQRAADLLAGAAT